MYITSKVAPDEQARSTVRVERPGRGSAIAGWARQWRFVLRAWRENYAARCRLRQCATLDRRFANDIGLTQDEVARLCDGPPWKPIRTPCGSATASPSVLRAGWDL